jgi:hypothetical protein
VVWILGIPTAGVEHYCRNFIPPSEMVPPTSAGLGFHRWVDYPDRRFHHATVSVLVPPFRQRPFLGQHHREKAPLSHLTVPEFRIRQRRCSFGAMHGNRDYRRLQLAEARQYTQDILDSIHRIRDALIYLEAREKAREAMEMASQAPPPRDPPQPAN